MKVSVDPRLCEAHGLCTLSAPDLFELDEDETLHLLSPAVPPQLRDAAFEAVAQCPKAALSVADD